MGLFVKELLKEHGGMLAVFAGLFLFILVAYVCAEGIFGWMNDFVFQLI